MGRGLRIIEVDQQPLLYELNILVVTVRTCMQAVILNHETHNENA